MKRGLEGVMLAVLVVAALLLFCSVRAGNEEATATMSGTTIEVKCRVRE